MDRNTKNDLSEKETNGSLLPIVFSTNDSYAPYAGVAIQSIILNANPHNTYRIYILYTSISAKHIEKLESMSVENVTVKCINVEQLISNIHTTLPVRGHVTKEAYYRILIPEIEELKGYPYAIYLDCDLIVNTDIAGIVPQNMADNLIAGVRDYPMMMREADRRRLEIDYQLDAAQYINSGVLVINIPQWIQEKTSKKCFDFLSIVSSTKFVFMDQDIINAVCKNRIMYLDESWNYIWSIRYGSKKTIEYCKSITDRIGENFHVLHFTTPIKPWSKLDHPFSHYFWKYAGPSPFFKEIIKKNFCTKAELEKTKKELRSVYDSVSFRVGRAITWAPRKLRGGVQCVRDHGTGYTIRRVLYHVGLWENEEAPKGSENCPKLFQHTDHIFHMTKVRQEGSEKEKGK